MKLYDKPRITFRCEVYYWGSDGKRLKSVFTTPEDANTFLDGKYVKSVQRKGSLPEYQKLVIFDEDDEGEFTVNID